MSTDLFPQTPAASSGQPADRHILYGDRKLRDPGPQFNAADIKAMYVAFFPELGNCDTKEEEKDGITTIRFVKRATTKGAGDRRCLKTMSSHL